jgi:hypothetical protein
VVIDAGGDKPVADVEVVRRRGRRPPRATSPAATASTSPAYRPELCADGIISMGQPPRQRLPGRPRTEQIAASRLEVAPDLAVYASLSGADLEVVRAGVISGQVFARRPASGALVRATPSDGAELRRCSAPTSPRPTSTALQARAGRAHYVVEAPRSLRHHRVGTDHHLVAGGIATADLTPIAGCVISGRVVPRRRRAGDGASARLLRRRRQRLLSLRLVRDDGDFRWTTTEGEVTLRAWPWKAPRRRPAPSPATTAPATTTWCSPSGGRRRSRQHHRHRPGHMRQPGFTSTSRACPRAAWASRARRRQRPLGSVRLAAGEYLVTAYVGRARPRRSWLAGHRQPAAAVGHRQLIERATGVTDGTFTLTVASCELEARPGGAHRHLVTVQGGGYRLDGLPCTCGRGQADRGGGVR